MNTNFWDIRYQVPEYVYGKTPNEFFREQIDKLAPGHILLPAEGEGRNAVYAAGRGWEVDAFDYSREARNKAFRLAREKGAAIRYEVATHYEYPFRDEKYDAVGLFFVHLPPGERQWLHRQVISGLRQGGALILEAFHLEQLNYNTGGPGHPDMLFTKELLETDFAELEIQLLNAHEKHLQEGPFHDGVASVISMVAVKP